MKSQCKRLICMALAAMLVLCLGIGLLPMQAEAASTYVLADLLSDGKIKPLGRTQAGGAGIATEWSGSGFEINVSSETASRMTIGYKSSYTSYWVILVDGQQHWRGPAAAAAGGGIFRATIPAGTHTVSVVKETQLSSSDTAYFDLTTLTWEGSILAAPAQKDLYIEFIGDSYSCGDGAVGQYEAGVAWKSQDDSATHSFPWYTAQALNADYSIVARGGIGLFVGLSEQEGTPQKKSIQDVYTYTAGFRTGLGEYDFSRQPDVIIVELGANDGIKASDQYKTIAYWTGLLESFTDTLREKNPDAAIVYLSHAYDKFNAMRGIVEARAESDPNLYAFHFSHNGYGSAALNTQKEGHPGYEDHQDIAKALVNYLNTTVLEKPEAQPSYTDIPYYVSETGSDSADGKSPATAKLTLQSAIDQAHSESFSDSSRLVVYLSGSVKSSNNTQIIAAGTLRTADGSKVPVLVTTAPGQDSTAILETGHAPVNPGNSALSFGNDVTLKDIVLRSTTSTHGFRDRDLYAGYNDVVFDGVTFDMTGAEPTNNGGWRVSAGHFANGASVPTERTSSSVTFRNGDYTGLDMVSAVLANSLWVADGTPPVTETPTVHHKLIIGDGAAMGNVYCRYGTLHVGSAQVQVCGGTVQQYLGTGNNATYQGDVSFTMSRGTVYGTHFSTAGSNVTITGDLNTTVTGGTIYITPKSTTNQLDAFFFGGRSNVTVQNIHNTICAGQFLLVYNTANVDSGFYFGGSANANVKGDVVNDISGGSFLPLKGDAARGHYCMYFGQHTGVIAGTLRNNISGGTFDYAVTNENAFYFGCRGVNSSIGSVENTFGVQGKLGGPRFLNGHLQLGGGWGQVGITSPVTAEPTEDECSDRVVIRNTFYGGSFSANVYCSVNSPSEITSDHAYYSFTKGSVETNIYSGMFRSNFMGAGSGTVYGHVCTNIHGGWFTSIYGSSTGVVLDGVETNIHAMVEYYGTSSSNTYRIQAGGNGGRISSRTPGMDAVKLTIAPKKAADLLLRTPIYASGGTIDGNVSVTVSGGTFPLGFQVKGKTVGQALASSAAVFRYDTGEKVAYAVSDSAISDSVLIAPDAQSYSNELFYYVSEKGQDTNDGLTPATAKQSLAAAFSEAIVDNHHAYRFPAGTAITIYVTGCVVNNNGNTQQLGGNQAMYAGSTKVHIPVTVATLDYSNERAVILFDYLAVNDGNASSYVINDITFKDIEVRSETNTATGFTMNKLYAAGCNLTFDNARLTTDGKTTAGGKTWRVSADHFSTGGFNPLNTSFHPHNGTLTFKNGDYTNINVAAVGSDNIYRSSGSITSVPQMSCKLIIDEGAEMNTVYGQFGKLYTGATTVEIRGGTVKTYLGTNSGNETKKFACSTNLTTTVSGGTVESYMGSGDYAAITGTVTNQLTGGVIGGAQYAALGNNVTLSGNLANNISGGKLIVNPTGNHGIYFGGRDACHITGNVTNTVTGGEVGCVYNVDNASALGGIYFGGRNNSSISGNLTNNISGGSFYTRAGTAETFGYASIHFGMFVGNITGDLINNISGGSFEIASGSYYFGHQGIHCSTHHIVNTLGAKGSTEGPVFSTSHRVILAGGWGRIGVAGDVNAQPNAATDCSDTVIVSNTIYGGSFNGPVISGGSSAPSISNSRYTYIKGSICNNIYGGTFTEFYGSGTTPVYGKAVTNIYGGTFNRINGAYTGQVYDGVELNIHAMTQGSSPVGIWAGPTTGTVSTQTENRAAVTLALTTNVPDSITLSMPLSAGASDGGTVTGTTTVSITGGLFPYGFAVDGLPLANVLEENVHCFDTLGNIIPLTEGQTSTPGYTLLTKPDLSLSTIYVESRIPYDGTDRKPIILITLANKTLTEGIDYTLSYMRDGSVTTDLISIGQVTVVATGCGIYSGSISGEFTIERDPQAEEKLIQVRSTFAAYTVDVNTVTEEHEQNILNDNAIASATITVFGDQLTEEETADLYEIHYFYIDLLHVIGAVKGDMAAVDSALEGLTAETVTPAHKAQLEDAQKTIGLLLNSNNLTETQRTYLTAQQTTTETLLAQIEEMETCPYGKNTWAQIDGYWYYFGDDGKMVTGKWVKDSVGWCYVGDDGKMVTNCWRKDSIGWVYLNAAGRMVTNAWVKDSVGWCYVGADGYAVTNCWKKDSVGWCYLNANGSMTKNNWVLTDGKWYYCDANGYMVSNTWMKDAKGWVYLGSDGAMKTNAWVKDSVGWCYVGADGYAVTNCWKKDSVGWCYLNANGSMTKSNWVLTDGKWYYCDANGYMVTGWKVIGGYEYYFYSSGVMAANTYIGSYYVDANGHYIPGK